MNVKSEDHHKRADSLFEAILEIQKIAVTEGLSFASQQPLADINTTKLTLVAARILETALGGLEIAATKLIAERQKSQR